MNLRKLSIVIQHFTGNTYTVEYFIGTFIVSNNVSDVSVLNIFICLSLNNKHTFVFI